MLTRKERLLHIAVRSQIVIEAMAYRSLFPLSVKFATELIDAGRPMARSLGLRRTHYSTKSGRSGPQLITTRFGSCENRLVRYGGHDVSNQPRDDIGRWTAIGGQGSGRVIATRPSRSGAIITASGNHVGVFDFSTGWVSRTVQIGDSAVETAVAPIDDVVKVLNRAKSPVTVADWNEWFIMNGRSALAAGPVAPNYVPQPPNQTDADTFIPQGPLRAISGFDADGTPRKILRDNLRGTIKPFQHAHHMVQSTHRRADPSRLILDSFQVDINDAVNGVPMTGSGPRPAHLGNGLHSYLAMDQVHRRLENAVSNAEDWADGRVKLLRELAKLKKEISKGTFP